MMIVSSTQDRIIECWCPSSALPPGWETKTNYYRGNPVTGVEFSEDNTNDKKFTPIQQSSMIIIQDTIQAYSYIIDTNSSALEGQTGHWVLLN